MGRRNCIVTRIVCLERGGINNDLGEKVLIFIYDFGMCLVFVVGKVRKKSVPFFLWGRCGRSEGCYNSRKIAIFLLGFCPLVNYFIGNAPVAPGLER